MGLGGGGIGGILGGLTGGPAGALLGGVIGNNSSVPNYTSPGIDSGTTGLIAQQQQNASQTGDQIAQQNTQGNASASNMASSNLANQLSGAQAGGYGAAGMQAAIQNKTAKNFAVGLGQLNNQQEMQGAETAMSRQNQATQTATQLNNYQMGVTNQVNALNTQAQGLRYQLLSGILGGAGSFAGAAAGSGGFGGGGSNPMSGAQNLGTFGGEGMSYSNVS